MEFVTLDFENDKPTTEIALAMLEIEIERMKKFGGKIIKVVHGYGSKGVGGSIFSAVRDFAIKQKRSGKIKDCLCGDEWSISNSKTQKLLTTLKNFAGDCDLNTRNPGITIIVL